MGVLRILLLIFLLVGVGCSSASKVTADDPSLTKPAAYEDSDLIPLEGSHFLGREDAPITIVTFTSMQCPYCGRLSQTLHELVDENPDVKVVFKHFPLGFQEQAGPASRAILAAGEQGKFWEMHDGIFHNLPMLSGQPQLLFLGLATELDLDVERFRADFERPEYAEVIARDMELGRELGVQGTPASFMNGELFGGAQPREVFEAGLERQRGVLAVLKADGVDSKSLYREATAVNMAAGKHEAPAPEAAPSRAAAAPAAFIPVNDDDPMHGNLDDPLITIVEFASYPCPFCAKGQKTLAEIEKNYEGQVRFVFKQFPLSFQEHAELASLAALAAKEQGKFWEVHRWLFENQRAIHTIGAHLDELELDKEAFEAALNDEAIIAHMRRDIKLGEENGVRGTPAFFINGVRLVGAHPYPLFAEIIDEQLEIAERIRDEEGLEGEALYEAVSTHNLENN
ncbi:MAG: DsbA family protein [Bradymonadaceae bacterium]